MKLVLVVLTTAAVGLAAAFVPLHADAPASTRSTAEATLAGPPPLQTQYGHIKSLVRRGSRYELRFDPSFWLGGVTAKRAAAEDGVIAPGEPVPNDYYIRDESRRLLTYLVPASARVTVVTNPATGPRSTAISVSELAQIVKGKNPKHRPIYGPTLGFWIRFATDTVRSLDQQYQP